MSVWLSPTAAWQWQFIPDQQQFVLHTQQQAPFVTAFKNKQLILNTATNEPFTLEQTAVFHEFSELLQHRMAGFPEPVLWHICIHAVAARFYHKAVANKSYWFCKDDTLPDSVTGCYANSYVEHYANHYISPLVAFGTQWSQSSEKQMGCGLVLSCDGSFATLLLLSKTLDVTRDKRTPLYNT